MNLSNHGVSFKHLNNVIQSQLVFYNRDCRKIDKTKSCHPTCRVHQSEHVLLNPNNKLYLVVKKMDRCLSTDLQDNKCVLHGEVIRWQPLSFPSKLLTLSTHEPSEVKSLESYCLAPFRHGGLPHVFWGTAQVSDKSSSQLSPPWKLFQFSGELVDLRNKVCIIVYLIDLSHFRT